MSKGKNQHYVPQFLMRGFSPDGRSVSLFNLRTGRIISQASIADQCSKDSFMEEHIDSALSAVETMVAPIIEAARTHFRLPTVKSARLIDLVLFAVLQKARTEQARAESTAMSTGLSSAVGFEEQISPPVEHEMMLRQAALIAHVAFDLRAILFVNETARPFVLGDAPAVVHNTLRQRYNHQGFDGLSCCGIQLFLPLSSKVTLGLIDSEAYETPQGTRVIRLRRLADVDALNKLQILNCYKNVYFQSSEYLPASYFQVVPRSQGARHVLVQAVEEGCRVEEMQQELIHIYTPLLCSDFKISKISVSKFFIRKEKEKVDHYRDKYIRNFDIYFSECLSRGECNYYDYFIWRDKFLTMRGNMPTWTPPEEEGTWQRFVVKPTTKKI